MTAGIMCNKVVNVLAVDFVMFSLVFEEFIGTTFSTLKSATKPSDYFFFRGFVILGAIRVWLSSLRIHDTQFDNDFLLI
jgi:hypothetical protein